MPILPAVPNAASSLIMPEKHETRQGLATFAASVEDGIVTVEGWGPIDRVRGFAPRSQDVLWTFSVPYPAIPETVSIAASGTWGCAGSWFSDDHVDAFQLPGAGAPLVSIPLGAVGGSARVSAAKRADLAVYTDVAPVSPERTSPALRLQARSHESQRWTVTLEPSQSGLTIGPKGLAVSRDGARVAIALNGTDPETLAARSSVAIFDGATGSLIGNWPAEGTVVAVDLTDDGGLCLATVGRNSHVLDTTSMTRLFTATGNGTGGRSVISGDGSVLVTAGFDLRIWLRQNTSTWTRTTTFSKAGLWFGWGASVSRDGHTVGVVAQDSSSAYLTTWACTFDADTGSILGSATTHGSGSLQDGVAGSVLSEDGSVFAAATWGTLFNDHPEVRVFSRDCTPIGEVDTVGSPMSLDLSPDGRLLMIGAKRTHANVFGVGGDVVLYDVHGITPCPCVADFDVSGGTPDVTDIDAFFAAWLGGEMATDADCSGGTPDSTDLAEFFAAWLRGGC